MALVSWNRNDLLADPLVLRALGSLLGGVDLHLRRQIGAGVLLLEHRQRRVLRIAQIQRGVCVVDAARDPFTVVGAGDYALGFLAHHNGGARVLAHRQDATGRDVHILEQIQRHEPVVARRLGIVDDLAQLGQVGGPQIVADVVNRLQKCATVDLERRHPVRRDQTVRGVIGADRQEIGIAELGSLGCTHRANRITAGR